MPFLPIDRISSLATTFCKHQTNTEQDNLLLNQTLLNKSNCPATRICFKSKSGEEA